MAKQYDGITIKRLLILPLLLSACASGPSDVPAIVVSPSTESQADLQRVVSTALSRENVLMARDALTETDLLIIERKPHRSNSGQLLDDRSMAFPDHFRLILVDNRCMLLHVQTERRWLLENTRCRPLNEGADY